MPTFITGDRKGHPAYVPLVAIEMLRAVAQGDKIVTSDNHGVDAIIREFGERAGIEVEVRPTPRDANGKRDYAAFMSDLDDDESFRELVILHLAPHESQLVANVVAHVDPEHSRIVGQEALV